MAFDDTTTDDKILIRYDSSDSAKRAKGRRGLDVLDEMQESDIDLTILEKDSSPRSGMWLAGPHPTSLTKRESFDTGICGRRKS